MNKILRCIPLKFWVRQTKAGALKYHNDINNVMTLTLTNNNDVKVPKFFDLKSMSCAT